MDSQGASSMDNLSTSEENAMLRQLGEKMVVKINQMKTQLMDKTAAFMAEQQLRKSAEVRLGNEMRKSYKLTAYNNEIAMANTKLQRQLKEARTEVERLSVENTCLQSTFKDLVEGLRDELKLRDSLVEEGTPQEGLQQDAVPEAIKQHVSDLIESSAEVFHIVATVAAHTGRHPPTSALGISPPLAPATPDQSDACSATSSACHSRQASLHGSFGTSSSISGGHEPERACSFESNSSLQQSPLPLPGQIRLLRGSSTSSIDGLSTASITSSPLINKEAPPLDEEQPGDIGEMLPSDFMGLHMGTCTPKSNQAGTLAADLTPRPAVSATRQP
ncbi:hypothetical protein WJX75_002713 [Coccomyxa subellipsoidea]|uniref:BZIP domain-containing protein n=1 Tax=Coccomyxa subellipsoidea TaxID=248742 RepID=A0ABR2YEW4_9CHLO